MFYVAAHQMGIEAFDVSNPANPAFLSQINLADNACWDVEVSGSYLFVANGRSGLSVVRLTNPPAEVAVLPLPGLANHIVLDGSVAVLSLGSGGIATVDISSPASPVLLDQAKTLGNAFGSGILNHQVAVGSWTALEIFDVSDPAHIKRTAWDNTKTWAMGADIVDYGGKGLVVVADWRGMSTYLAEPDGSPDIDVSPARLDFGEVVSSEEIEVKVRNTGTEDLNVSVSNIPSGIQVDPQVFTLGAGLSRKVRVTASGSGTVDGSLLYNSNDPDEPSYKQYVYKNNTSFPQVDSEAPDFVLKDPDGYWHYLSDYRGKVIYLEFGGLW